MGVWAVAFIVSFFPHIGGVSIWGTGIQWILPIGVPTVAVFLLILRRFSPDGIRRVGSLGHRPVRLRRVLRRPPSIWVGDALERRRRSDRDRCLRAVLERCRAARRVPGPGGAHGVRADLVPGLKEDFHGRLVTLAHRNANPVRPVIARPRPEPRQPPSRRRMPLATYLSPESRRPRTSLSASRRSPARHAARPGLAAFTQDWQAAVQEPHSVEPEVSRRTEPTPRPTGSHRHAGSHHHASSRRWLDVELSGQQATDEIARLDLAEQVPLVAHASGGDTGTEDTTADEEYVPTTPAGPGDVAGDTRPTPAASNPCWSDGVDVSAPRVPSRVLPAVHRDRERPTTACGRCTPSRRPGAAVLDPRSDRARRARRARRPIFRIGPSAWALVIEDRGGAYVVRHDDGRIGYLHDIADITKG